MERFKVYLYTNLIKNDEFVEEKILITDSESISWASTYGESFSIEQNGEANFSFSIMDKLIDGKENPFIDLIKPESVIGLHLPDRQKNTENKDFVGAYYKFKVNTRTPNLKNETIEYNISATDFARAVYSKQANGLEYEKTGTLREIAEDLLGVTRKNVSYFDLNMDISKKYEDLSYIKAQEKKGFKYSDPYINYENSTLALFKKGSEYAIFEATDKFINGMKYDMQIDVVSSILKTAKGTLPVDFRIGVRGIAKDGKETFSSVTGKIINFEKAVSIRFPFTYSSTSLNKTERIELTLHEIEDPSDGSKWPTETGTFSVSMTNFKISKSRSLTEDDSNSKALRLNHIGNFEQFKTEGKGINEYTKMTFSVTNSNFYIALINLATLFEAEVRFDYVENAFYFVSKKKREYIGYKLNPDINLNSISRPETSADFATIFHVEGDGDAASAMPPIPKEWRRYLGDCVRNDFKNAEYFNTYGGTTNYRSLVQKVSKYIDKEDSIEERMYEIGEFAEHLDMIPNFESTLYDFSYFKDIGVLSKVGSTDYYQKLINTLYNDVRKLNISLNIYTYTYYVTYSAFTSQLTQIAFYVGLINAEEKFIFNTEQKLDENNPNKPDIYTSSWVSYMNAIDSAKANIANFKEELNTIVGIDQNGVLDVKNGSFTHNACMLFGYTNENQNGIQKLIDENQDKINDKLVQREDNSSQIKEIEKQLDDPNTTTFLKESLSVEMSGLLSKNDNISNFLGRPGGNRGTFLIESGVYTEIKSKLKNNLVEIDEQFIKKGISLFSLLYDRENKYNIPNLKEKSLEILMDEYESFALEARYQNSDEVSPRGLLEQGLNAFTKYNRPQVSYSISAINISALDEYSYYKHPEVGDKVELEEGLYLSYDTDEETDYLVIVGYSEKLREMDSLSLTIEQDDESDILVKRMLEKTNFVEVGKGKRKSANTLPVPPELSDIVGSVDDSIEQLNSTGLSIAGLFNPMLIK